MQEIKIVKAEEIGFDYADGYAETEILAGTCPGIRICKCRLQAGKEKVLEVFGEDDRMQLIFFTSRSGIVKSGNRIFAVDDQAVFIPDFDRERVVLTADDEEMQFIRITGPMTEIDHRQMKNCQYVLPRFVRLRESIEYTERFTQESGSKVVSHSIVAGRHLGRYTMGWNIGAGPDFIGQHTHPTLEQWYFMIDGSDFTYTAGGREIPVREGDVSFTPHGTSHGSQCSEDGFINYVWFELNRAWEEI
ncbi:MAG: cupin domain-containing protein [Emergencia sp.]